jgi:agmatine deiminase
MIKDAETNTVYFSELIRTDPGYAPAFSRIGSVLERYGVQIKFIRATKDIWCRDYMPVQVHRDGFVQFRYEPDYLKKDPQLRSDPVDVCAANGLSPMFSSINLDGGNVVRWSDRVIISERIFRENPEYSDRLALMRELENLLEAEVILIPDIRSDMTGHADGMVRFMDRNTVVGNSRRDEYITWVRKLERVLLRHGLSYVDAPFFEHRDRRYPHNALGCYVNYLEVGSLIVLPIFDLPGNHDAVAVELFRQLFPDRTIETVNINEIGYDGGLLNCVTWTVIESLEFKG